MKLDGLNQTVHTNRGMGVVGFAVLGEICYSQNVTS